MIQLLTNPKAILFTIGLALGFILCFKACKNNETVVEKEKIVLKTDTVYTGKNLIEYVYKYKESNKSPEIQIKEVLKEIEKHDTVTNTEYVADMEFVNARIAQYHDNVDSLKATIEYLKKRYAEAQQVGEKKDEIIVKAEKVLNDMNTYAVNTNKELEKLKPRNRLYLGLGTLYDSYFTDSRSFSLEGTVGLQFKNNLQLQGSAYVSPGYRYNYPQKYAIRALVPIAKL